MRPPVSPSVTLAAAALAGVAVLAGISLRPDGRVTGSAPSAAADPLPRVASPASVASDSDEAPPPLRSASSGSSRPSGAVSFGVLTSDGIQEGVQQSPGLDLLREFHFTRAIYSGGGMRGWGRRGRGAWSTDYPKADRQFLVVVERLTNLDLYPAENAVRLDDPDIRRFPFLYALEVGAMRLSPPEVEGLRSYLEAGGFLVIDDFWGTREWENFEREIRRVLPGREIVDLPMDHPVFATFYNIEEVLQVPGIGRGINGRPTWEGDGRVPRVRGIADEQGRLMVLINWNTDLGDAWEHAESPYYPLEYSTFAYQMGVNMIVYAMTH